MTMEQRAKLQPMPVRLRHYLLQRGGDLPVWTFVACPLTQSQGVLKCCVSAVSNSSHGLALPSMPFCISPRERLVAIRITYSLSDLISRFTIMDLHRSGDGQQHRTIFRLLTPRQGVIADAKEYPTALSSVPRVLIADTCSISPGYDAFIAPGFPSESLIRKDAVWQGVAADRMCSCTWSHVRPSD